MRVSAGKLRGPVWADRMRRVRSVRACSAINMPSPSTASQTLAPEIISDAAHDIQAGRHAGHPDFAAIEEPGKTGGIAGRLAQQIFKFQDFRGQRGFSLSELVTKIALQNVNLAARLQQNVRVNFR
jgi:hypothetical protein